MTAPTAPRAYILTLGCPKNEADSERMASILAEGGYRLVHDLSDADVAIVNTCSFIAAATEESISAILDISDALGDDSERRIPIVVSGCMSSRYGSDLADELDEVSAFVPCDEEGGILQVVDECLGVERDASNGSSDDGASEDTRTVSSAPSAYVKISEGCSRTCAYCTIPSIRGPYHSFDLASIEDEVRERVESGTREIVLIGQDTGIWGRDLEGSHSLASLLAHLAETFPHTWFRAMYTQPESITDELLDTMATHANVCSYLDIPMQHCVRDVLASMGRKGSREELEELVARIRERVPGIVIRTTLMAGFPGETEEDFDELVGFVEETGFDYAGVFAFSPEEGTAAASMDGQVDEDERSWRAERLRDVADAVSSGVISQRIGSAVPVLIEGSEEDGQLWGRTMGQAPEVDGVTYIDGGEPGDIVQTTIVDTLMYDMEGEVANSLGGR